MATVVSSRLEILKEHGPKGGFVVRAPQASPVGDLSHVLMWFPSREQAEAYISWRQAEESAMKSSVVDNFRDPEETAIPVEWAAKPLAAEPKGPALGDLFVVQEHSDMFLGPFKTEDEAIAAAKEDFMDNDTEGDERYFLCRIAKKLRLFRPLQVDEEESEDR